MAEVTPDDIRITEDEIPEPPPRVHRRSPRRPAAGGEKRPSERPRKSPSRAAKPAPPGPAETVKGLLQIPATGVVMVGQRIGSVPLVADGATVIVHGPPFADAIEEWAKVDPRVAIALEKLVMFGPASAVVMALVIMGAQFARNHNEEAAPILAGFGAVSAPDIIAAAGLEMPVPVVISPNGSRDGAPPEN